MVLYYRVKIMYFNKIMKSYQFIFLKIPWKFFSNSLVIYTKRAFELLYKYSLNVMVGPAGFEPATKGL